MSKWVDVVSIDSLPEGSKHVVVIEDRAIAVFHLEGAFYAIEDSCTHQGLPISEGPIEGTEIECPFHGARFCLKTGKATCPPAYTQLKQFPTRMHQSKIQINLCHTSSED